MIPGSGLGAGESFGERKEMNTGCINRQVFLGILQNRPQGCPTQQGEEAGDFL